MKKTSYRIAMIILSLLTTMQTAFAEDNIMTIIVNSNSQQITFDANNKSELTISADSMRKTISISLPPNSTNRITLPWCNNKTVDAKNSASCPASSDAMTLTFIKEKEEKTPIVQSAGAVTNGSLVLILTVFTILWCCCSAG